MYRQFTENRLGLRGILPVIPASHSAGINEAGRENRKKKPHLPVALLFIPTGLFTQHAKGQPGSLRMEKAMIIPIILILIHRILLLNSET
jgi:hypothetical protein